MTLALSITRDAQMQACYARAKLRALELQTGQATDDNGRYWLARTAALERVAAAAKALAQPAPDPGPLVELRAALDDLERVQAPVCREGDHQVA